MLPAWLLGVPPSVYQVWNSANAIKDFEADLWRAILHKILLSMFCLEILVATLSLKLNLDLFTSSNLLDSVGVPLSLRWPAKYLQAEKQGNDRALLIDFLPLRDHSPALFVVKYLR